jgi:hypothetical protein
MRLRAVVFLFLCVAVAACSSLLGDFGTIQESSDAGVDVVPDAGVVDAAAQPDASVRAVTSGIAIYLGQTAVLDASKSTTSRGTLSFAWGVDGAPDGSGISLGTTSLSGANTATVSFLPDVVGTYTLHVKVSAFGSSDTLSATVIVSSPQVLYAQGVAGARADGGAGSLVYIVSDLDGGNAHPVLCPDVVTGASSQGAPFAVFSGRAYDFWEAPPSQISRFAAFTLESTDAGLTAHLWSGTASSTCMSPPVDLGTSRFGPGRPYGAEPNFRPSDGQRFVVYDKQWRIVTYASDGSGSSHVVADYSIPYSAASSFLDPVGLEAGSGYLFEPPRVVWTATGLAWAQPIQNGWEIVTAPDQTNAPQSTYLTCSGIVPREIAILADGTVLASYRDSPGGSEDLWQLKPDAQRNCTHEQQYTHLSDAGASIATDFAVSPDGTQIAFLQIDPSTQDASPWMQGSSQFPGGYVYVTPVTGGAPKQVSKDPALYGPRWIAGGTALVFTRLDGFSATGRAATSVVVLAPDGGGGHAIAQGDGVSTFVSTSGNAACSVVAGQPRCAGWVLWILPLWAAIRRRRPRG